MSEEFKFEEPVFQNVSSAKKTLLELSKEEKKKALNIETDVEAFRNLHSALSRNGPLSVDSLLKVATKHNIKATKEDIAAIFAKYDANQNADLELKEFAAWWGTATDGLSVLLRNALSEAILAPGTVEQWKRGNCIRFDMTSGNVDDSFEAKSGIYVTVVPSNEESVREVAGISDASVAVPVVVAAACLTVKKTASDEDVQGLIDLVNLIIGEMPQFSKKSPFKLKINKETSSASGNRIIKVSVVVENLPRKPKEVYNMVMDVVALAGLKNQALFRRIMIGLEFGGNASEILSTASSSSSSSSSNNNSPVADLIKDLRVSLQTEYDDALIKVLNAAAMMEGGVNNKSLIPLLAINFLARGARNIHLSSNFASQKEVIDALIDNVSRVPFTQREGKTDDEIVGQAFGALIVRTRLQNIFAALNSRSSGIYGLPKVWDMICGELPDCLRLSVFGVTGSGKTSFISKLWGATSTGPSFNGIEMHMAKKKEKGYLVLCETADLPKSFSIEGKEDSCGIAVIDASSESKVAESLRLISSTMLSNGSSPSSILAFIVTKTEGSKVSFGSVKDQLKLCGMINNGDGDGESEATKIYEMSSTKAEIPKELLTFLDDALPTVDDTEIEAMDKKARAVLGEDKEKKSSASASTPGAAEEEEEEGLSMEVIGKKIFKLASGVISGIGELEVTTPIARLHVLLENFEIGNLLSEKDPECIRRHRLEQITRMEIIMEYGSDLSDIHRQLVKAWEIPTKESDN